MPSRRPGRPADRVGRVLHDLLHPVQVRGGEHRVPVLVTNQVGMQRGDTMPAGMHIPSFRHEIKQSCWGREILEAYTEVKAVTTQL
jgi:hypothetical protein